ncbi:hypothetical protein [Tsukamurella soli]|uniref:Lipopolysaccharide assembly protein A domain-containing protein n=1 Tax=Tsukamurella soli TaxID=644556 RepID=A0ABP8JXR0_9ACTN
MIVLIGLVVLIAAVVVGLAAVLGNSGSGHALTRSFSILGYHVTGSTGTLFLYGAIVGAVGLIGLSLVIAGGFRASRRGRLARRQLNDSRQETADAYRYQDQRTADQRETDLTNAEGPQRRWRWRR